MSEAQNITRSYHLGCAWATMQTTGPSRAQERVQFKPQRSVTKEDVSRERKRQHKTNTH